MTLFTASDEPVPAARKLPVAPAVRAASEANVSDVSKFAVRWLSTVPSPLREGERAEGLG